MHITTQVMSNYGKNCAAACPWIKISTACPMLSMIWTLPSGQHNQVSHPHKPKDKWRDAGGHEKRKQMRRHHFSVSWGHSDTCTWTQHLSSSARLLLSLQPLNRGTRGDHGIISSLLWQKLLHYLGKCEWLASPLPSLSWRALAQVAV